MAVRTFWWTRVLTCKNPVSSILVRGLIGLGGLLQGLWRESKGKQQDLEGRGGGHSNPSSQPLDACLHITCSLWSASGSGIRTATLSSSRRLRPPSLKWLWPQSLIFDSFSAPAATGCVLLWRLLKGNYKRNSREQGTGTWNAFFALFGNRGLYTWLQLLGVLLWRLFVGNVLSIFGDLGGHWGTSGGTLGRKGWESITRH